MAFPTVAVLDSFKGGNESPLSHGGDWKEFFPSGESMGEIAHKEWETDSAHRPEGAYWQPAEFTEPGVALEWAGKVTDEHYWELWACVSHPTSALISGYVVKLKQEGGGKFAVELEKCVANVLTELAKTTAVAFAVEDRFGLSVQAGKVIAWRKKGGGAWEELISKADGTYTTGFVGFVAEAGFGDIVNFEAGPVGSGPPVVTNPGTQHSVIGEPVSLQIKATNTTEYKATGLPEGLSINEGTGLITGTPEKLESTKVKVKVKGPEGTDETEFEWVIEEASAHKKNRTFMIL